MLPEGHHCRIDVEIHSDCTLESTDKMKAMEQAAREYGKPPALTP
jgi:hypothetical protein